MSPFDAEALPDDELARIAYESGFDVATVNEQAENARAHQPYEEQVQQVLLTYGGSRERAERLVRMVRAAVAEHRS